MLSRNLWSFSRRMSHSKRIASHSTNNTENVNNESTKHDIIEDCGSSYLMHLTANDYEGTMDLLLNDFLTLEPFNKMLKLKKSDGYPLMAFLAARGVVSGHSCKWVDKETDKMVGVRLCYVNALNAKLGTQAPLDIKPQNCTKNVQALITLLDRGSQLFKQWNAMQVHPWEKWIDLDVWVNKSRRLGVSDAKCSTTLMNVGFDYNRMREDGLHGMTCVSTSKRSLGAIRKSGYMEICEVERSLLAYHGIPEEHTMYATILNPAVYEGHEVDSKEATDTEKLIRLSRRTDDISYS